jgi:hypothetical protein
MLVNHRETGKEKPEIIFNMHAIVRGKIFRLEII